MPRPGAVSIRIEGLDELRRDLKEAGNKAVNKKLRQRLKDAAEVVASDARGRVPIGPEGNGHARDTIKAGATPTSAYVTGGKASSPYYGWLDFGSRTPNRSQFSQGRSGQRAAMRAAAGQRVGPWANTGPGPRGGRFIYPAIEANSALLVKKVHDAIDQSLKEEGL